MTPDSLTDCRNATCLAYNKRGYLYTAATLLYEGLAASYRLAPMPLGIPHISVRPLIWGAIKALRYHRNVATSFHCIEGVFSQVEK
jgi:hypothetical protein